MLYGPLLLGLATAPDPRFASSALLTLGVTGVYLARNAIGLLLRRRRNEGLTAWTALFTLLAAAGLLPLLGSPARDALLDLAGWAIGFTLAHTALLTVRGRKRLDRTLWGEALGVAALALVAPAGRAVGGAPLDRVAFLLWILCALFFSSSLCYVKMRLAALKFRRDLTLRERLSLGQYQLAYHAALIFLAPGLVAWLSAGNPWTVAVACLPVVVRSVSDTLRLTSRVPSFQRLGAAEGVYALWFAAWTIVAFRSS